MWKATLLTLASLVLATKAQNTTSTPLPLDDGDTAWVLTSTALVMFMTPGLAFFYGGMVSWKSVLNTVRPLPSPTNFVWLSSSRFDKLTHLPSSFLPFLSTLVHDELGRPWYLNHRMGSLRLLTRFRPWTARHRLLDLGRSPLCWCCSQPRLLFHHSSSHFCHVPSTSFKFIIFFLLRQC